MGLLLGFPDVTLGWCQAALRTSYWTLKLPAQILQLKKWSTGLRSWASITCHRLCGNINLLTAYGPKNRRICFTFTAILLRWRGGGWKTLSCCLPPKSCWAYHNQSKIRCNSQPSFYSAGICIWWVYNCSKCGNIIERVLSKMYSSRNRQGPILFQNSHPVGVWNRIKRRKSMGEMNLLLSKIMEGN